MVEKPTWLLMQYEHLPLFYIGRRGGVVLLRWTPVGEVWARDLAGLLYYIHGRNILLSRPLSFSTQEYNWILAWWPAKEGEGGSGVGGGGVNFAID